MLRSDQADVQLEATKKFRQLLSVERDALVQDVLDRDIVPQLLHFLKQNGHAALQVEALWALTNIAAGATEHTHMLLKNDAVPTLVSLLSSTHQEVLEQAVWVLGNIAGDGTPARDKVLEAQVLTPLLQCMQDVKKTSLLRIATWTLSNLCDGQPRPDLNVHAVLATLRSVLQSEDTEVLSHACWALSHLCDGPSPHIEAVVEAEVCPRLVQLLPNKSWRVVKPALRTVGNIVCAEDEQDYTQQIIECGAVPCLKELISHNNRDIQKEACWTLSNIAAGTIDQIQQVLESGSIPTLVKLASKDADTDPDVKIEACWVLLNATSCGSDSQIEHLVREGCVAVLCNLLQDNSMVMMALEGLEKILQVGEETTTLPSTGTAGPPLNASKDDAAVAAARQDDAHSILLTADKIQDLQKNRNAQIAKRATRMWKQYFVICAICQHPYSKQSPATKFCTECKCNVCVRCDCSRFHLSYQENLWKEIAEDEAKGMQNHSKGQSKKSKNKKKKVKDKKKKDNQSKAANKDNNTSERDHSSALNGNQTSGDAASAPVNPPNSSAPPPPSSASAATVTSATPGTETSNGSPVQCDRNSNSKSNSSDSSNGNNNNVNNADAKVDDDPKTSTTTIGNGHGDGEQRDSQRTVGVAPSPLAAIDSSTVYKNTEDVRTNPGSGEAASSFTLGGMGPAVNGLQANGLSNLSLRSDSTSSKVSRRPSTDQKFPLLDDLGDDKDTLMAHNDVYVDFLNKKGSILDLWKIMDEDDSGQPDEDLMLLHRQAMEQKLKQEQEQARHQ